jgi:3-hydroxyisobutyrate dehydrogenase-like beta-hydroxyacid dehydrogenase
MSLSTPHIAIIGYGEAGRAFSADTPWCESACVYDIDPERTRQASLAEAVADADIILSLVTADQALLVAQAAAEHIKSGALFCDMNSVAPQTKQAGAAAIEANSKAHYVDVAIMAPVNPARRDVPLLLSGASARSALEMLAYLGFSNMRLVGEAVGRASTIKMLRSVMYKGVEALTAECLLACEKAGVAQEVLGSFGNDWASGADYRLDRMLVHGTRRAAEMKEVVKTLIGLGVEPALTRGTVARQRALGALGVLQPPEGLDAKLSEIEKRLGS